MQVRPWGGGSPVVLRMVGTPLGGAAVAVGNGVRAGGRAWSTRRSGSCRGHPSGARTRALQVVESTDIRHLSPSAASAMAISPDAAFCRTPEPVSFSVCAV